MVPTQILISAVPAQLPSLLLLLRLLPRAVAAAVAVVRAVDVARAVAVVAAAGVAIAPWPTALLRTLWRTSPAARALSGAAAARVAAEGAAAALAARAAPGARVTQRSRAAMWTALAGSECRAISSMAGAWDAPGTIFALHAWHAHGPLNTSLPDMHVRSHEAQKRGGAGKGNWGAAGDEGNT